MHLPPQAGIAGFKIGERNSSRKKEEFK